MKMEKMENCSKCGGTGQQIDQVALGRELRDLRVNANISLRRMAIELDITPPYLVDLEHGRRSWSKEREAAFRSKVAELRS